MDLGQFAVLIPVVTGLVGVVTQLGLRSRFAPIVSLGFGILLSFLLTGGFSLQTVLLGIVLGLGSSGLYSGTKAVVKG